MATFVTTTRPQNCLRILEDRLHIARDAGSKWANRAVECLDPRKINWDNVRKSAIGMALKVAEFTLLAFTAALAGAAIAALALASLACPISLIGTVPGGILITINGVDVCDWISHQFTKAHSKLCK